MNILILEDGTIKKKRMITDEDKQIADDGYMDIINIANGEPLQYYDGKWHELEEEQ